MYIQGLIPPFWNLKPSEPLTVASPRVWVRKMSVISLRWTISDLHNTKIFLTHVFQSLTFWLVFTYLNLTPVSSLMILAVELVNLLKILPELPPLFAIGPCNSSYTNIPKPKIHATVRWWTVKTSCKCRHFIKLQCSPLYGNNLFLGTTFAHYHSLPQLNYLTDSLLGQENA